MWNSLIFGTMLALYSEACENGLDPFEAYGITDLRDFWTKPVHMMNTDHWKTIRGQKVG